MQGTEGLGCNAILVSLRTPWRVLSGLVVPLAFVKMGQLGKATEAISLCLPLSPPPCFH